MKIALTVSTLLLIAVTAYAGITDAMTRAKDRYAQDVAKAQESYAQQMQRANDRYAGELDKLIRMATRDGDADLVATLQSELEAVESGKVDMSPTSGPMIEFVVDSQWQNSTGTVSFLRDGSVVRGWAPQAPGTWKVTGPNTAVAQFSGGDLPNWSMTVDDSGAFLLMVRSDRTFAANNPEICSLVKRVGK